MGDSFGGASGGQIGQIPSGGAPGGQIRPGGLRGSPGRDRPRPGGGQGRGWAWGVPGGPGLGGSPGKGAPGTARTTRPLNQGRISQGGHRVQNPQGPGRTREGETSPGGKPRTRPGPGQAWGGPGGPGLRGSPGKEAPGTARSSPRLWDQGKDHPGRAEGAEPPRPWKHLGR